MPVYRFSASVFHVRYAEVTYHSLCCVNTLLSAYNPLAVVLYEFPTNHTLPEMHAHQAKRIIDTSSKTDNRIYINAGSDLQVAILLAHEMFGKYGKAWFADSLADGVALVARLSVAGVG